MMHLFDEWVLRGFRGFSGRWPAAAVTVGERDQLTPPRRNYPPQIPLRWVSGARIQIYEARVTAGSAEKWRRADQREIQYAAATGGAPDV